MFCTKFLVCLKFLKNQAAMLTTTCNAINAPSQQLLNKKCPWCVCFITLDVSQILHMQKTFSWSCCGAFLARMQILESAGGYLLIYFSGFCVYRAYKKYLARPY